MIRLKYWAFNNFFGGKSSVDPVEPQVPFNTHSLVTTSKQQGVNFTDNSIYPSEGGGVDKPFTKEIWFKPLQVGRVGVILRAVDSNTSTVLLQILQQANGTIRCDISSSAGNRISMITSASTIVEVNKFYCLVVSYSGTKLNSGIKMYLNGVLPSLVNGNSGTYIGLPPLQGDFKIQVPITDNTDTIWFNGKVSLIRSYNIALDATQAGELYNGNEPRSLSGLDFADSCVLEYRFNNNLISNTGVNPEPVGELVFDTDTPWSVPNHKMDFSQLTQLESVFWPRIYKSSDWPQWETTKDYFTIYSTDHGIQGGIAWAECDDPFYNGFVERGIIRSGSQSETPWLMQIGAETLLYYHIFTGEGTPNQRTGLMIATGGVLHTATWTEQTPPLGYVEGENHLGYARVISNAGGYVAHHVTHGNPSIRHAISHSTDGKTFIRGIETTNRTVGGYVYTSISPFIYNGTQYAFVVIAIDGGQKIAVCTLDADTLPLAVVDIIPEFYTVTIIHSYVEGDTAFINIKWSYIGFRNKPHYVLTYDLTQLN